MTKIPGSAADLVATIVEANNELRVTDPKPAERAAWRRVIYAAINSDAAPPGLRLRHSGRDRGDLVIRLVPNIPENEPRAAPLEPVAVPDRLARPHALIAATRDVVGQRNTGWVDNRRVAGALHINVAAASVRRVLLVAHGLVEEAVRRGHQVHAITAHHCPGGLGVFVDGHGYELFFAEETVRVPHEATNTELAEVERYSFARNPEWDLVPSGRVQLKVGHSGYDQRLTGDRTRWKLEDRLAVALAKIEELAAEAEQRRLEAEARDAERKVGWQTAMDRAHVRHGEAARAEHLRAQVDRWRRADEIRAFVAHVRATAATHGLAIDKEWLEWADRYADTVDSTQSPVIALVVKDPSLADLEPFLEGWSPYGPERSSRRF